MHALCSLLRRDPSHNFKGKGNPLVPVLAANLVLRGFQDKKIWPDVFLKVKFKLLCTTIICKTKL
jgi:integrator complex subunit 1